MADSLLPWKSPISAFHWPHLKNSPSEGVWEMYFVGFQLCDNWTHLEGQGYCHCSVTQSCPTLFNPMDCSTPDFPVLHYLPEFAQTHVHRVSDTYATAHLQLYLKCTRVKFEMTYPESAALESSVAPDTSYPAAWGSRRWITQSPVYWLQHMCKEIRLRWYSYIS